MTYFDAERGEIEMTTTFDEKRIVELLKKACGNTKSIRLYGESDEADCEGTR